MSDGIDGPAQPGGRAAVGPAQRSGHVRGLRPILEPFVGAPNRRRQAGGRKNEVPAGIERAKAGGGIRGRFTRRAWLEDFK